MSELQRQAVILLPERQVPMEVAGAKVTLLVKSSDTGGKYAVIDYISPPTRIGPALHYHQAMDESFHVIAGELAFQVGQDRFTAKAGSFVHVPPGVPHAFWNESTGPTHFIVTFSPAGLEEYFIELFDGIRRNPEYAKDIRPLIKQFGSKYDQIVVGPSPGILPASSDR